MGSALFPQKRGSDESRLGTRASVYLGETGCAAVFGRGYGLVGLRLGISFLPCSVLAPALGEAELAGEAHELVELSRGVGVGGREPEARRTGMTLEVKARGFKEKLSLSGGAFFHFPNKSTGKGRLKYPDGNTIYKIFPWACLGEKRILCYKYRIS